MSLSDRVRPGVEAAPWVVREIRALENRIALLRRCLGGIARCATCGACSGAAELRLAADSASTQGDIPVESTSDQRTVNNVMRHAYRVVTEQEKAQMQAIKDKGLELFELLESIGSSREISVAKTKVEEAVMWGVKHITR